MSDRAVFRVNYFKGGQEISSFICAESGSDAVAFLGATDMSGIGVFRIAAPVEVVGLDAAHAELPPLPINKVPIRIFDAPTPTPPQFTKDEVARLQELLKTLPAPIPSEK